MAINTQPGGFSGGVSFNNQNDWSHGICGCFDDFGLCCCVMCCPCFNACAIDKAVGVRLKNRIYLFFSILNKNLKRTESIANFCNPY